MKKLLILFIFMSCSQLELGAQELSLRSGFLKYHFYQDDEKINKSDFVSLLKNDAAAYRHWERSTTYNTLSWIALTSEVGFATWGILNKNPKNDTAADIGVYSSFATVIVFSIVSHAQKKKAIKTYNQNLNTTSSVSIEPSKKGLGFVISF